MISHRRECIFSTYYEYIRFLLLLSSCTNTGSRIIFFSGVTCTISDDGRTSFVRTRLKGITDTRAAVTMYLG